MGWRAAAAALACMALAGAGCGGDDTSDADDGSGDAAVETSDPERTFAPLVELAPGDRYRPTSARAFVNRSLLSVAAEEPCDDYAIAVGRTLGEQRTEANDWIYIEDLGEPLGYYRNPYDKRCEPDFDRRFYTSDLTRPLDAGPRLEGVDRGAGFYLDLVDEQRGGGDATSTPAPVYAQRSDEGDRGVRIAYWMLFGMNAPPGRPGATHEGDWEHVDVLLRDECEDRYVPLAVQLTRKGVGPERRHDVPWESIRLEAGTHPTILSAPGSHAMSAARPGKGCPACVRWRGWDAVTDVRKEPWYGFGGGWGEPGPTEATTGPLGPHGDWPTDTEREQAREEQ